MMPMMMKEKSGEGSYGYSVANLVLVSIITKYICTYGIIISNIVHTYL